jgi:hypothetical protein
MRCFERRPSTAASLVVLASVLAAPGASAQQGTPPAAHTEAELGAARALFGEALHDQQEGRLEVALGKFRQVREVRDTAAIEYRIGTCHEGLGRFASALAAYQAAVRLGEGDAGAADVVRVARERAEAVGKRAASVMLRVSSGASRDADVRVDGVREELASLEAPVPIDPGKHVVTATARDAPPFRMEIAVPEAGQVALNIPLDPPPPPPPEAKAVSEKHADSGSRTAGWISIAAGGFLVAGSVATLILRQVDINKLNSACPAGQCSSNADQGDLQSTRSRALIEGPLAGVFGVAGVLAAGVGVVLVTRSAAATHAPKVALLPLAMPGGGGLGMRGGF